MARSPRHCPRANPSYACKAWASTARARPHNCLDCHAFSLGPAPEKQPPRLTGAAVRGTVPAAEVACDDP